MMGVVAAGMMRHDGWLIRAGMRDDENGACRNNEG